MLICYPGCRGTWEGGASTEGAAAEGAAAEGAAAEGAVEEGEAEEGVVEEDGGAAGTREGLRGLAHCGERGE